MKWLCSILDCSDDHMVSAALWDLFCCWSLSRTTSATWDCRHLICGLLWNAYKP